MRRTALVAGACLALALTLTLAACDAAGPTDTPALTRASADELGPTFLRGGKGRPASGGAFSSPLFGLATAPNGDVLVADAGAGIADRFGRTEIALRGVSGIAPIGRGSMWAVIGAPDGLTHTDAGQGLYRVSQGNTRRIANLFAFEAANNPDGAAVDSNPFDVASLGGNAALVIDAGANTLLRVSNQGRVEVLAVFPAALASTANIQALAGCPESQAGFCFLPPALPAESVPTSVAVGPDGYYYVGELRGFPAPTNASSVWRVSPNASGAVCGASPDCVKVFDGGFTSIIDLAFGPDGRLYVAEMDEASWAAVQIFGAPTGGTVNACNLSTLTCTEVATGIPILTAITFGKDGALWATKNALIPGLAEVVRLP